MQGTVEDLVFVSCCDTQVLCQKDMSWNKDLVTAACEVSSEYEIRRSLDIYIPRSLIPAGTRITYRFIPESKRPILLQINEPIYRKRQQELWVEYVRFFEMEEI